MTDKEIVLQMSGELGCDTFFYDDKKAWKENCLHCADFPAECNPCGGIHALCENERITRILFSGEPICEISPNISKLSALVVLDFFCVSAKSLPASIADLSALKIIRIDGCSDLKELPDSIGKLSSLKALEIDYSGIEALPESIGNLPQLKVLCCFYCRSLYELPSSIGNLSALEHLNIACSRVRELPKSIVNLTKLVFFDAERCEFIGTHWFPDIEIPQELKRILRQNAKSNQGTSRKGEPH